MILTAERLAEITEMLAKITPGKWSRDSIYWILRIYWKSGVELDVPDDAIEPKYRGVDPDFIAAAPEIIRELLNHITLLEANTIPTLEMIRDELSLQIDFWRGIATGELDYAPDDIGDWLEHKERPSVSDLQGEIEQLKVERDVLWEIYNGSLGVVDEETAIELLASDNPGDRYEAVLSLKNNDRPDILRSHREKETNPIVCKSIDVYLEELNQ